MRRRHGQQDRFTNNLTGLESPLSRSEVADVTSGDHVFSYVTRAILVTGDGNLIMRMAGDNADLTLAITAGAFLPFRVREIKMASTADVIGFW